MGCLGPIHAQDYAYIGRFGSPSSQSNIYPHPYDHPYFGQYFSNSDLSIQDCLQLDKGNN
jgi:hypothetical protein